MRRALADVYAYFRATESRWLNIPNDGPIEPERAEFAKPSIERWGQMRAVLAAAWGEAAPRRSLPEAALGHALDFRTWQSPVRKQRLDDQQAIAIMVGVIRCLVTGT